MDIIRGKLGLTAKYKFKPGSAMVTLALNPIFSLTHYREAAVSLAGKKESFSLSSVKDLLCDLR